MRSLISLLAVGSLALFGLASCGEDEVVAQPTAAELTREEVGHYCGMIVVDHKGPKAQIHLTGDDGVVWFSSVRDAIAFMLLPEEPKNIAAAFVNDMGRAQWDAPEPGTWIDADDAWYVIESSKVGGMGAAEAIPFAERDAAERFAAEHGGRVVALADIPDTYILASTDDPGGHDAHDAMEMDAMPEGGMNAGDSEAPADEHGAHQ